MDADRGLPARLREEHRGLLEAPHGRHRPLTCRIIAQPHPRPPHDLAHHLRRLRHPLSTCRLASRWKEDMAFLRSFYVADDIWRFAWSLVGCLLALSWLPTHTSHIAPPG